MHTHLLLTLLFTYSYPSLFINLPVVERDRQEQIRLKAEKLLKEKYESEMFSQSFIQNARDAVEQERREAERRKQLNLDNANQLQEHIAIRRQQEELERQNVYLQQKEMEYMEKLHAEKLRNQGECLCQCFYQFSE